MRSMFLTLEVSKLTGWLKAAASCRVESRACDEGRGVQAGRRGSYRARGAVAGASGVHVEDQRLGGWGGQGTRG